MSRDDHQKALLDYFQSGAVVCPYARRARYAFLFDIDGHYDWLVAAVAAHSVAVWIDRVALNRTFEEARDWALAEHGGICRNLGAEQVVHLGRVLPHVEVGSFNAYAIGMGPQYPVAHPRYAPRLCLVAVNGEDVRGVSLEDRSPIRRAMMERAGAPYDADRGCAAMRAGTRTASTRGGPGVCGGERSTSVWPRARRATRASKLSSRA